MNYLLLVILLCLSLGLFLYFSYVEKKLFKEDKWGESARYLGYSIYSLLFFALVLSFFMGELKHINP